MEDDLSRYDKPQKPNYFEAFVPRELNQSDADHRAVKNLTAVQNKLGPMFGHADAARYYRELATQDAENAGFYRELASQQDRLAEQKAAARLVTEKLQAEQDAFAVMREVAREALDAWCREQGLGPKAPDTPDEGEPDLVQGCQIQGCQPDSVQGCQIQGCQPDSVQGCQIQGCQPDSVQGCQIQGCQPDSVQGCQIQGCQPTIGEAHKWLLSALANGPRLQSELVTEAKAAGLSERSLRRAKAALSVQSVRQGKPWLWTLPPLTTAPMPITPGADDAGESDTPPPPGAIDSPCPTCGKPDRLFVKGSNITGEPLQDVLICGSCGHRETPAAGPL